MREGERYSDREREIGRDSTLLAERERARDWTLMPDVFMCIYMQRDTHRERER